MPDRILSLESIYKFTRKNRRDRDALRLESKNHPYCVLCNQIVSGIEAQPGFYIWGYYDSKKYWRTLYLGKAGMGKEKSRKKTNLKERILEELKDERPCFWRPVHTTKRLAKIRRKIHANKYGKQWKRALRKQGATYIAWVPTPHIKQERDITRVEADLIEALNPKANVQRPMPPNTVQKEAVRIFERFRHAIHAGRQGRVFKIKLKGA